MECNRDEALRAKEIAERKFNTKDISGAKKFALKAQNLFPELEGISQMIATLDVYLSAEARINGESDWYSILSVNALANEETVKKQYRKLALQLHPDKNKSIGAEGAFKLISEAWSVLSDKTRKMVYDQKRNAKGFQQRVSQAKRGRSVPNAANGFYNFANGTASNVKVQKNTTAPSAAQPKLDTFWTSCNRCRMQYEYLRIYLNHNLLCPNCHEAFFAVETGVPSNGTNASVNCSAPQQHRQNSNHSSTAKMGGTGFSHGTNHDAYDTQNFQWGPFSRGAGAASATASSSAAAQAANMVHQTYERVKREREEAQAAAKREDALRRKNYASKRAPNSCGNSNSFPTVDRLGKRRRSISEDTGIAYSRGETDQTVQGMEKRGVGAFMTERAAGTFGDCIKSRLSVRMNSLSREFAQLNIRNLLIERSKMEIHKKLEEWNSAAAARLATKEKGKNQPKQKENYIEKVAPTVNQDAADQNELNETMKDSRKVPSRKDSFNDHDSESDKEAVKPVSIDVPDPDFHDFDKDRSERAFESDQVWASYDNEDGMPRFYILIQKVLSYKPFKVRMSFLNSKSNSELGPMKWVASGFAKTCGDFRVGRYQVSDTVNIFSHKIRWEKGPRGVVRVVPQKGDTWAVYKNWSPEWNELTPDDVIYKYDMVEVLDDYIEDQGVSITPLVKVAGFKTVFHRHLDPNEVRRIPREEMFRFSHQVPSHLLTGEEAPNAPKGCRELDPAATPVELLQVMTEVKEDEAMGSAKGQPVD